MNLLSSKKTTFFLLFLLLFVFLLGTSFVFAQKDLEVDYPTIPGAETPTSVKTPLPDYVKYIFNFSLAIVSLIAFGALIYGGVLYLTSAGNPSKMGDARGRMFAGILGLIVLFSSYLILTTINPQLVIMQVTKPDVGEPPPMPPPLPPMEKQTLYTEEIPIGKLIDGAGEKINEGSNTSPIYEYEGVLAQTRLKRLKKLFEETWDTSKQIKETAEDVQKTSKGIQDASQKIVELTARCACGYCNVQGCGGCGSCGGCDCSTGEPCPDRGEIQRQQALLEKLSAELPPLKSRLERLVPVLKEKTEELQLEQEKLRGALAELEEAENMMKKCPYSTGAGGKVMVLLDYGSFWDYKKGIEAGDLAEKIEIQKVWENVYNEGDETTFYCVETPFDISLIEGIYEGNIEEGISEIQSAEEPKTLCETKLPVGEAIDNSEDISQRIMDEIDKIVNEVPKIETEVNKITGEIPSEKANAEEMAELPNQCQCSYGCACHCIGCCCCGEGCCCYCYPSPCRGTPCPFGEIESTNADIEKNHQKITEYYNKIAASHQVMTVIDDEAHNLIVGDEIHSSELKGTKREPTWAYNIVDKELPGTRANFGRCSNLAEDWAKAIQGETVLGKQVVTCEEAKDICWDIEEEYECHGYDDISLYTNYFCAETESK